MPHLQEHMVHNAEAHWTNGVNVWRWKLERALASRLAMMVMTHWSDAHPEVRTGFVQWVLLLQLSSVRHCYDSLHFTNGECSARVAEGGKRHCDMSSNYFCHSWKILNKFKPSILLLSGGRSWLIIIGKVNVVKWFKAKSIIWSWKTWVPDSVCHLTALQIWGRSKVFLKL